MGGSFPNPLGYTSITTLVSNVIQAIVYIAFPIIILFLVYAGFLFVTAQGNEEKITTAKRVLLWTIIGALLVLGAQVLVLAISGTVEQIQGGSFF